jgi:hypothetical protein
MEVILPEGFGLVPDLSCNYFVDLLLFLIEEGFVLLLPGLLHAFFHFLFSNYKILHAYQLLRMNGI